MLSRKVQQLRAVLERECPGQTFNQQVDQILSARYDWARRWSAYEPKNIQVHD